MHQALDEYEKIAGTPVIEQLRRLGDRLKGRKILHVNSTAEGGGVAEILSWMTPLMQVTALMPTGWSSRGQKSFSM